MKKDDGNYCHFFEQEINERKVALWMMAIVVVFTFMVITVYRNQQNRNQIRPLEGVVLSHHTSSNTSGNIRYYTVIKTNQGEVKSLEGLNFFTIPVGEKIKID